MHPAMPEANRRDSNAPDLMGPRERQVAPQIRIDLLAGLPLRAAWPRSQGFRPHLAPVPRHSFALD